MPLFNSEKQFGSITKLCHWSIFALFVIQYFLVYRREYFPKDAPEKLQYILLHKSLGVVVLGIAVLMLFWRAFGQRPKFAPLMPTWEKLIAHLTHFLLYVSMFIMPVSGIVMSQLSDRAVKVFDWFTLPTLFTKNPDAAKIVYGVHLFSSYIIIGVVSLHILAAFYHHFIHKDTVLKRMLPFRKII